MPANPALIAPPPPPSRQPSILPVVIVVGLLVLAIAVTIVIVVLEALTIAPNDSDLRQDDHKLEAGAVKRARSVHRKGPRFSNLRPTLRPAATTEST